MFSPIVFVDGNCAAIRPISPDIFYLRSVLSKTVRVQRNIDLNINPNINPNISRCGPKAAERQISGKH